MRRTYRTDAGFELVMLALAERNDAGRISDMVLFDADDRYAVNVMFDADDDVGAIEELERRHLAGLDGHTPAVD